MVENKTDKFVNWLMRVFSVKEEDFIVTHKSYKWSGSKMLRETHVRYNDGTTAVIHTNS